MFFYPVYQTFENGNLITQLLWLSFCGVISYYHCISLNRCNIFLLFYRKCHCLHKEQFTQNVIITYILCVYIVCVCVRVGVCVCVWVSSPE